MFVLTAIEVVSVSLSANATENDKMTGNIILDLQSAFCNVGDFTLNESKAHRYTFPDLFMRFQEIWQNVYLAPSNTFLSSPSKVLKGSLKSGDSILRLAPNAIS